MTRALVLVLAAGCLGRPQPHGHASDGGVGDGVSPDGDPCAWQGPVPIVIPGVVPSDAVNGPWLDNSRTELWFARFSTGNALGSIYRATFSAGTWNAVLKIGSAPNSFANPFLDEKRNTVWYDEVPTSGPRHLGELDIMSGSLNDHNEATNLKAPSLTPDGGTLYTTGPLPYVIENTVSSNMVQFGHSLSNPMSETFESPSVTSDGAALYVTQDGLNSNIYVATLTPAHDGYTDSHLVGTFQVPGKSYFDPNISRDGETLVFASNFEGPVSRIYYVTRPAGCAP